MHCRCPAKCTAAAVKTDRCKLDHTQPGAAVLSLLSRWFAAAFLDRWCLLLFACLADYPAQRFGERAWLVNLRNNCQKFMAESATCWCLALDSVCALPLGGSYVLITVAIHVSGLPGPAPPRRG